MSPAGKTTTKILKLGSFFFFFPLYFLLLLLDLLRNAIINFNNYELRYGFIEQMTHFIMTFAWFGEAINILLGLQSNKCCRVFFWFFSVIVPCSNYPAFHSLQPLHLPTWKYCAILLFISCTSPYMCATIKDLLYILPNSPLSPS